MKSILTLTLLFQLLPPVSVPTYEIDLSQPMPKVQKLMDQCIASTPQRECRFVFKPGTYYLYESLWIHTGGEYLVFTGVTLIPCAKMNYIVHMPYDANIIPYDPSTIFKLIFMPCGTFSGNAADIQPIEWETPGK